MENLETQRKVREVYVGFAENGELTRVDGNKSKKQVADDIAAVVKSFVKKGF
jgi:thymidylate kinase